MNGAPDREMTFGNTPYVVLRVQITPDILEREYVATTTKWRTPARFKNESERIRKSHQKGYDYAQTYTHKARESEWGAKYEKAGLRKLIDLNGIGEKKTLARYNALRKLESIPDTFVVVVGVVDKSAYHEGIDMRAIERDEDGNPRISDSDRVWKGEDLDYDSFFRILCDIDEGEFDPLIIYRKPDVRESAERKLLKAVLSVLRTKSPTKKDLVDCITRFGRDARDNVRDYIRSGEKPPLSGMTSGLFRPAKEEVNDGLYGFGDGGSLVETGQLLFAIEYQVFAEQSSHMRSYVHRLIREHDQEVKKLKEREVELKKRAVKRSEKRLPSLVKETKASAISTPKDALEANIINKRNVVARLQQLNDTYKEMIAQFTAKYQTRNMDYWSDSERASVEDLKKRITAGIPAANAAIAYIRSHGRRI